MKTVIVSKSGTSFCPRDQIRRSTARGEAGETEGLLRHLISRGDVNVVYFGKTQGDIDVDIAHAVVNPDLSALREHMRDPALAPPEAQVAGWEQDAKNLRALEDDGFLCMLNMTGYSPTRSSIANPTFATVQAAAINYVAPTLAAVHNLNLKRVCIVTDPRCYPKEQEMSDTWPRCRPYALLDQHYQAWRKERTIAGIRYATTSAYCASESWGVLNQVDVRSLDRGRLLPRVPSTCVAHAHVDTGIKQSSWAPWEVVLDDVPDGFEMWGEGWYESPWCDPEAGTVDWLKGPCKSGEVEEILGHGLCCPIVEHTWCFATGKPYVCAAAGSIPVFYGDDSEEPGTYDKREIFVDLNSKSRVTRTRTLRDIAEQLYEDYDLYEYELQCWREMLVPDFSVIDDLLDDLLEDGDRANNDGYYGGYKVL